MGKEKSMTCNRGPPTGLQGCPKISFLNILLLMIHLSHYYCIVLLLISIIVWSGFSSLCVRLLCRLLSLFSKANIFFQEFQSR